MYGGGEELGTGRCQHGSARAPLGPASSAAPKSAAPRPAGWPGTCFLTATTAAPGKEVWVTGIGERLLGRREAWHTLAWAIFGGAFVGAVVFVSSGLESPPGDVLLVLAAGSRLSAYIGATVWEIGFLRSIGLDGSRRLAWLEDYAASLVASADQPVPSRLFEDRYSTGSATRSSSRMGGFSCCCGPSIVGDCAEETSREHRGARLSDR